MDPTIYESIVARLFVPGLMINSLLTVGSPGLVIFHRPTVVSVSK